MASTAFRARFVGGRRATLQLRSAAFGADLETQRAVREAGEESVFIFAAKASKGRTRRLSKGVRARFRGETAAITSTARSNQGFAYTAVTRFGHRVRFIRPVHAKALRFRIGNRVLFRSKVRGFHPQVDWADTALPAAERTVAAAGARAGRRIVARVG